jgi:hypothetical protein
MRPILAIHSLLLLLASTSFTIVTAIFGGDSLNWCYYHYSSQSGFEYVFVSDFSLPVVITYLLAFVAGLFGFALAFQSGRHATAGLGFVLSAVGAVSFTIEGSHWLVEHHRSLLAFSPLAMFALALVACLPQRSP